MWENLGGKHGTLLAQQIGSYSLANKKESNINEIIYTIAAYNMYNISIISIK